MILLDIMDKYSVKSTCFFLGWVAERFPGLLLEAQRRGHEIASHGYSHVLASNLTQEDFLNDALKSKQIIEQITGTSVLGFRASGFSYTESTGWLPNVLAKAGFKYDSSLFPANRAHGGMIGGIKGPHIIKTASGEITEIPISVAKILGRDVCFFGGGYFRLFPFPVIKHMAKKVLDAELPVLFYLHPREIDSDQPRLQMNLVRKFKSYYNIASTKGKLSRLFDSFEFVRIDEYLKENGLLRG